MFLDIICQIHEYLFPPDNLFEFMACHNTEFCMDSLLKRIAFYTKRNTTVFRC